MALKGFNRLFFILLALVFVSCSESEFSASGCEDGVCDDVSRQAFTWEEGQWTQCSRACGGGLQTRTITCVDGEKTPVLDSECVGTKPATQRTCGTDVCVGQFSWNIGPWSNCTQACGGNKTRVVVCQSNTSGAFVDDSSCTAPKPATTEPCPKVCPPETYIWVPGAYNQPCKCGIPQITRTVTCRSGNTNMTVADSLCNPDNKPAEVYVCPQTNCSTYSWVTGQYGACSKKCGGGLQTRSIGCIRDKDAVYVPFTLCDATKRPVAQIACNTQVCPPKCEDERTFTQQVDADDNQLDILLVVDDSGSMYQDSSRLATKLAGFVNRLENSNINWQMCVTSTDVEYYQGRPIQWQGANSGAILRKNSGNLNSIFVNTMRFIGAGFSSDEQAIKAMNLSVQSNNSHNCYRDKAGLAVIVISDEDERSVGGNRSLSPNDYRPLGALNTPQSFINTVRSSFSAGKRVTVNSIVVRDTQCQAQQNAQGERSFFGTQYMSLSNQTGGTIQSICMNDYTIALNSCYERIRNSLGAITLSCVPTKKPTVLLNGGNYGPFVTQSGNQLIFNPVIQGPATVTGTFCCK